MDTCMDMDYANVHVRAPLRMSVFVFSSEFVLNISKDHFQDTGMNTDTNPYFDTDADTDVRSVESVK